MRHSYDMLSEMAHPNWAGTLYLFGRPNREDRACVFGPSAHVEELKLRTAAVLGGTCYLVGAGIETIAAHLPGLVTMCERELGAAQMKLTKPRTGQNGRGFAAYLGVRPTQPVTRTAAEILQDATETLRSAEQGLADLLHGRPERRLAGLRNAVVFGRAVTNVLENLRNVAPGFDEWYGPVAADLRSEPLMRWFYQLRSQILKQGILPISGSVKLFEVKLPGDFAKLPPPPPNAVAFFAGDAAGGMGWEVQIPGGPREKFYVELGQPDIVAFASVFSGAPDTHEGRELTNKSIENLTSLYVARMRRVLGEARQQFGEK